MKVSKLGINPVIDYHASTEIDKHCCLFKQKELENVTTHSNNCVSERDSLREEKAAWVKREANLRIDVKQLEEACSSMEKRRILLESQLKDKKARDSVHHKQSTMRVWTGLA